MILSLSKKQNILIGCVCAILTFIVLLTVGVFSPKPAHPWDIPQEAEELPDVAQRLLKNPLMYPTESSNLSPTAFANSTLYLLTIPSRRVWSHVPMLLQTLLTQYPNKLLFSDNAAKIGDTYIIDAISTLDPAELEQNKDFEPYRIRRFGNDEAWGWTIDQYPTYNEPKVEKRIPEASVKEAAKMLGSDIEWVVIARETDYVSQGALDIAENRDIRISSETGDILILSRRNFERYAENGQLPAMLESKSRNISSTFVNKENWCSPLYAFSDLHIWELQSLFGRDTMPRRRHDSHLHSAFYRDFILPYISTEKKNWVINPQGPVYYNVTEDGQELTKPVCEQLCQNLKTCLAWEWHNDFECRLETEGVRRGIAMNYAYINSDPQGPLVISGWMVDRIRQIRLDAECDSLKLKENGETNDSPFSREGFLEMMRERTKLEGSDILKSIEAYENELDNTPE